MSIQNILEKQRDFFNSQATKSLDLRKTQLKKLKQVISDNENLFYEAIHKDFGKSQFDTYTTELSIIYGEINYYLKNLKSLMKPKSVKTNLPNLPGSSKIYQDPLGCSLVIGAWNYPYQLSICPMISAIAAGNTCILKPSEVAENTMKLMADLFNKKFDERVLHVEIGGVAETTELLKLKFDKIFFTGSPQVGKIVYEAAAKNLTPVTLELGGKSPALVTENANLEVAAKRIIWGKFLNAGQTCVAPDYILVDKKVVSKFIEILKNQVQKNDYQPNSSHFTRIINEKHFNRLISLIDDKKIIFGGKTDLEKLYIQPTLLSPINWNDKIMQEEIFGPLLPILVYDNFDEALNQIRNHEKPLSAYLFSNNSNEIEKFTTQISFGGACINDVVMHLANENLPFGGVGNSGIGNYHGKYGFEAFTHQKSVLKRATWGEPNIKYPPYSDKKLSWIKKLM
ncbi:aldehyde dehydrogenase [Soonwooa sp.]|uniref:aldehyde dehydrogenase n=2 Tax=Soonwooa sp. TaxID=1938592 RepID=UPI0028AB5B5A|nr:aldehyde dehydrogenase [Soonwooa sp.]